MINKDKEFMQEAIKTARAGIKTGQTPFGAVIVKNNKVIAKAHNLVWKNIDSTAHAEVTAIRTACKKLRSIDLSGCTIYSTCEPCPMCFSACHWAKINQIVYGIRIKNVKKLGFNELLISDKTLNEITNSKIKIKGNCMRTENIELLNDWAKQHKRAY